MGIDKMVSGNQNNTEKTSPLVSCDWLRENSHNPGVRIVEVVKTGEDYRNGHIPGAIMWPWKEALWHNTDREFATPQEMADRLGKIGISPETTMILYGEPYQYGIYAFWVLTMCGHRNMKILDGGRKRWIMDGNPLSTTSPVIHAIEYSPQPGNGSCRVGRDDILANLSNPDRLLLDVRSPKEYRGESIGGSHTRIGGLPLPAFGHGAERSGHIPGAVNLYFRNILNDDDTFKSPDELRIIFEKVGASPEKVKEIVTYCRLSHRGSLAWFTMTYILGYTNVRVYDGSWTEWGSIVGVPIEK